MRAIVRACWLLVQCAHCVPVLAWLALRRRRCSLLLTHHQDRDAAGRDQQTGPLRARLGRRCIEVARVPLTRATWARCREPVVFYAPLVVAARLLAWRRGRDASAAARTRVVRSLLRLLRPSALFLIDESGSGQPFVRAGRALGIRSIGIQHGDFSAGDPLYDRRLAAQVVAADVLCVWSPWFLTRLCAISAIYTPHNVCVTGRLRHESAPAPARDPARLRVLLLGEASAAFPAVAAPFVEALRAAPGMVVEVQPHPAVARGRRDLIAALRWCDVAFGMRSSALLEALHEHRPIVVAGAAAHAPDGLCAAGLATPCFEPADAPRACRAAAEDRRLLAHARATVWRGGASDVAAAVLAAAGLAGSAAGAEGPTPSPPACRAERAQTPVPPAE